MNKALEFSRNNTNKQQLLPQCCATTTAAATTTATTAATTAATTTAATTTAPHVPAGDPVDVVVLAFLFVVHPGGAFDVQPVHEPAAVLGVVGHFLRSRHVRHRRGNGHVVQGQAIPPGGDLSTREGVVVDKHRKRKREKREDQNEPFTTSLSFLYR